MSQVNEPNIGDTVRMRLDLVTDVSAKLVEIQAEHYLVEIQRSDTFKRVEKGDVLRFAKSQLVEFCRN